MLTGGSAASMKVVVYERDSEKLVCNLDNDSALLGSYPIDDGMRLHVSKLQSIMLCLSVCLGKIGDVISLIFIGD